MNKIGEREVFFDLNGQMRSIFVLDTEASKVRIFNDTISIYIQEIIVRPRALPGVRGSIGAPMPGEILELKVKEGDHVHAKSALFVLSAMKVI